MARITRSGISMMADIAFLCPKCGHTYEFAPHLAGKRGRCKACQTVFRIPAPPPSQPAAPAIAPVVPQAPAALTTASRPASRPPSPSGTAAPADEGKIVFQCPACGHGYRLDAKLAGKHGRCTTCRGVFTIPLQSRPPRPAAIAPAPRPLSDGRAPGADRPAHTTTADPGSRPPGAAMLAADDSGWWELDSSESIPAKAARAGTERYPAARMTAPASKGRPALGIQVDDEGPLIEARPVRPRWVTYAAIAVGVLIGAVAYAVAYSFVSNALSPAPTPVADQAAPGPGTATPPEEVAEAPPSGPGPTPAPTPSGVEAQHREAVEALVRAYNDIADGYARIRGADSIPQGRESIDRGVEQLRAAAQRARNLPHLAPAEREAVIRRGGPPLLEAIDRVLGELRRLKDTPGLRSDFNRLIDAYTRSREDVRREIEHP